MIPRDGSTFMAVLTTVGRSTGREHSRPLKAVMYNGRAYFSRHRPDSDWFRNAVRNPEVVVEVDGERLRGVAREVDDEGLLRRISELKYPGEGRAAERRVAVEVRFPPCAP